MKIVLDTNVLVSGIFFSGPPSEILRAWSRGKVRLVVTREIFDEYWRVAAELRGGFPDVDVTRLLELILVGAEICAPAKLPDHVCADPDDDKFFACAVASGADVVVSGDKHLLKVSGYRGIPVMTPRMFVDQHLRA